MVLFWGLSPQKKNDIFFLALLGVGFGACSHCWVEALPSDLATLLIKMFRLMVGGAMAVWGTNLAIEAFYQPKDDKAHGKRACNLWQGANIFALGFATPFAVVDGLRVGMVSLGLVFPIYAFFAFLTTASVIIRQLQQHPAETTREDDSPSGEK